MKLRTRIDTIIGIYKGGGLGGSLFLRADDAK